VTTTAAPRVRHAQVRLVVGVGPDQRHVALRGDVALADALRAALVPLDAPGTAVLDSAGRRLDLALPVGAQLDDGAAVHVVRPAPAPRGRRDPAADAEALARRPRPRAALLALAGALGLVLLTLALTGAPAVALAGWDADLAPVLPAALVVALVAASLVVAGTGRRRGGATPTAVAAAATFAAPALAAAAGAWAVLPDDAATVRLAGTVALVAATTASAVRAVIARAARIGDDEALVVLAALVVVGSTTTAALLLELPGTAAAAFLLGLTPVVLRVAPRLALAVPDEQLVDVSRVSRTADSVRHPRPRALGRVSERLVARTVAGAERRVTTAVVVATGLAVALVPLVVGAREPGTMAGIAAIVLVAAVVVAFVLVPRVARDPATRWLPRLAAGLVLVAASVAVPAGARVAVAAGAILLALVVTAVGAALGRGWHSVVASRAADACEGLAVVLALPAAVVAADLVESIRQAVS